MGGGCYTALALIIGSLAAILPGSRELEMVNIEGPSVVVNGSSSQLVLDCLYHLTESDKTSLVVKWYFNRQPYPVYQWIPHNRPQDFGLLKDRVNLDYVVSEDEYCKHRALAIITPTTELSGEYTCWISSFENEDYRRKNVIVYAPASEVTLRYHKLSEDRVLVSCHAGRVYPAPDIAIYRISPDDHRSILEGARVDSRHYSEFGYFNVTIELEVYDSELEEETMFECVLQIPDTEYRVREKILYLPGLASVTAPALSGVRQAVIWDGILMLSLLFIACQHLCQHC